MECEIAHLFCLKYLNIQRHNEWAELINSRYDNDLDTILFSFPLCIHEDYYEYILLS